MRSFDSCADAQDCTVFGEAISDRALELAACVAKDGTTNLTIAFCSGLDECPRPSPRPGTAGMDL